MPKKVSIECLATVNVAAAPPHRRIAYSAVAAVPICHLPREGLFQLRFPPRIDLARSLA